MSRPVAWKVTFFLCAFPAAVSAGEIPKTFTLGRYVPDTCWLYVHEVDNPERAYIDGQWARVFDALAHSGIDQDVKNLIGDLFPPEDRAAFDEQWGRIVELVQAVSWSDLARYEFAHAQQLAPLPAYLFLFRGTAGSGEKNAAAMREILVHLASLDESLEVSAMPCCAGFTRSCLIIPGVPFCIDLFQSEDMIGISTSPLLTKSVLSLATGGRKVKSILDTERFRQALTAVPDPEDKFTYLDFKALAADLRILFESGFAKAEHKPEAEPVKGTLVNIVQRADVFDYLLEVQQTDGLQERTYSVAALQPDRREMPFAKVFANRKPLADPYRFVPAEATEFSVSCGIDLDALYALILDVIRENAADGEAALTTWAELQDKYEFHLQEDLFDWLSGETVSVTLPASMPTPIKNTDSVGMFRVKDSALAARKLDAGIARLQGIVREYGNMELIVTPALVKAPGFRTLTYPPLIMLAQPVVGVYQEWLVLGTSAEAINVCLDTAAGDRPNILKSERFRREGILRTEPASSASFTDLSNMQQQLSQAFHMAGVVGGIVSQIMREQDEEGAKAVRNIMSMIQRLAPVVLQIDFYSSQAGYCTFDGRAWRMEKLTTYKPPATKGK
ncbi:MAG TPA: hypothetical protein VM243_12150 [Phycisphaerae bacterium]|nr:hypothetical protein [Phycisphaerae bacterium]